MKRAGLQWLYRLIKEPKRHWRRYLLSNPKFVWIAFVQLAGLKELRAVQGPTPY
jgi:N-acetylglucosaminyldiphosphoundecaprenol N-acetyl-beta-D-mannosaminyltransferase